jgi:hypothetical protein
LLQPIAKLTTNEVISRASEVSFDLPAIIIQYFGYRHKFLPKWIAGKYGMGSGSQSQSLQSPERGKDLIIEKVRESNEQVLSKTTRLPALSEQQPEPLV